MTITTQHIAKTLLEARQRKGLSQRALADLAGVPQSHISKIESGAVDLRLSSLIELSRALDLELALVPRSALPAVQSIARSTTPAHANQTVRDTKELAHDVRRYNLDIYPRRAYTLNEDGDV